MIEALAARDAEIARLQAALAERGREAAQRRSRVGEGRGADDDHRRQAVVELQPDEGAEERPVDHEAEALRNSAMDSMTPTRAVPEAHFFYYICAGNPKCLAWRRLYASAEDPSKHERRTPCQRCHGPLSLLQGIHNDDDMQSLLLREYGIAYDEGRRQDAVRAEMARAADGERRRRDAALAPYREMRLHPRSAKFLLAAERARDDGDGPFVYERYLGLWRKALEVEAAWAQAPAAR